MMNEPRLRRHPFGFLEVVDRPTAEELAEYYARTYYQDEKSSFRKSYPAEELDAIELRIRHRGTRAQELMSCAVPGRLLDVGCGEGFVLSAFDALGWTVCGMDHSRAGVESMNPAYADRVEQGDVFANLKRRVAVGERYELIWLGNVLEHVLDPVGLLETLRPLIAPGGVMTVTVPNDGNAYHEELLSDGLIDRRFWIAIPDHLSYFTADSLRNTAERTGWQCLDIHGDFPIDLFLAHEGSNYVRDRSKGPAAHRARLRMERLIGRAGTAAANRLYAALADVGLGRDLTAYLTPKT